MIAKHVDSVASTAHSITLSKKKQMHIFMLRKNVISVDHNARLRIQKAGLQSYPMSVAMIWTSYLPVFQIENLLSDLFEFLNSQ